ncbi:MAG: glycosyltransferase family 39 protein [Anaerolineae bacterium]|nr:glycosyltransferase family 39 protein [Anaerolineae bacterium]
MKTFLSHKRDLLLAVLVGLVAFSPRILNLDLFLTADEPKSWFGRAILFLDALARADWAATFDSPAPGVTTMWAGSIGLLLEYARQGFPGPLTDFLATVPFDPLDPAILPLIRLPIVLLATLTAILTFWWGRAIFGRPAALLAALFIALDPFILALTRILGHDGPVTLFIWLSLLTFLRTLPPSPISPSSHLPISPSPFLILSGIFGGLAFLSKYPSLFLGAFIAVTILILHLRHQPTWLQALRATIIDVAIWSIAAGVIFVLLWPAMWVDPIGRTLAIAGDALRASGSPHQKGSFFFGHPVPDPGLSFYAIVTLFKTTPIIWLGWLLLALSIALSLFRKKSSQFTIHNSQFIVILLAFALAFAYLVTIGGKKQDRYILPAFPALITLAALGYTQIQLIMKTEALRIKNYTLHPTPFLIAIVVIAQIFFVLPTHPYYFTYYNRLLGGGPKAAEMIIVGWGEGMDAAARWLNAQPDAHSTDAVAWYSTTFEPYFDGHAIYKIDEAKISRTPKPGLAADYVILYINQLQRELPTNGALQFYRAVPPAHVVTLNGLDYAWIYPSLHLQHIIENDARLVGQAELLGFNLLGNSGDRLDALRPDQHPTIELYWEWQGKAPAEPIGLGLADYNGEIWGQSQPLGTEARVPFEQWQDGMVARDDFTLTLWPGTPPGDYYLKAWIDRPATGERVGDFPLVLEDVHVKVDRPAQPLPITDLPLTETIDAEVLDGQVKLLGLTDTPPTTPWQPGETRTMTLYWQALQTIDADHPIELALLDAVGTSRAAWNGSPAAGNFPTDRWQSGDIIRDPWRLTLPSNVPPGDYRLTAQLGETMPIELLAIAVDGRPRIFEPPSLDLVTNTSFGESIELLGLRQPEIESSTLSVTSGQPLDIELVWQADNLIEVDYTLTAQLLDAQQQVIAQRDSMPLNGSAPTTTWAAGEVLIDPIALDIPADVGSGPHTLLLALYRVETGERLTLPNGDDHFTIPVTINSLTP